MGFKMAFNFDVGVLFGNYINNEGSLLRVLIVNSWYLCLIVFVQCSLNFGKSHVLFISLYIL